MTETMISSGFPKLQKDYYKVYVRSNTYNQASYIEDCLNGVAKQETDFPFVHHVIDDCSTDGEQEVIKAWIDRECDLETTEYYDNDICTIILAKHKNNPNYTITAYFLKRNMYGNPKKPELYKPWEETCPYEAICEGDDYWISSEKLQTQVIYLEEHSDIVLTCHRYKIYDQENKEWSDDNNERYFKGIESGFSFSYKNNKGWLTKTLTLVFRTDLLDEYNKMNNCLDSVLVYCLMKYGRAFVFNDFWGVYRKQNGGLCSKKSLLENTKRNYGVLKKLYYYDPNSTTRRMYYNSYATMFLLTKGHILLEEKFELCKCLSLGFFYTEKLYRFLFNKRK